MSRRARSLATAFGIVALFALPLLPEILGTRLLVFRDAHVTHWPWRRVAMAALDSGRVPFVNGNAAGGQPLLANPNAVLLYPTVLLERVLQPVSAFNLHYLLEILWAFFGARLLARRFGISPESATFAGAVYAFSGIVLSYGSAFMNSSGAAAWLPWCGAAALGLLAASTRGEVVRAGVATGLAFGLQLLAGEPAISALTAVFVVSICLVGLFLRPRGERRRALIVLCGGGAISVGIAAAFAAPLLLPLRAVFPLTFRGQHIYSKEAFGAAPFSWSRMIEWFFPRFSGDPSLPGSGSSWLRSIHRGELVYIWCATFGVLTAIVILVGACRRDFWNRRSIPLAAAALAAFLFSFGFQLPFYRLIYAIEALRRLRYPIKFYLLTTVFVALLAGLAADSLQNRKAGRREGVLLAAVLALYAIALLLSGSGGPMDHALAPHLIQGTLLPADMLAAIRGAVRSDALLGAAAALLLGAMLRFRRPARMGNVLGILVILFALPWALPLFVTASAREMLRRPALVATMRGPGRLFCSPAMETPDFAVLKEGRPGLPRLDKIVRGLTEELIPSTGQPFGISYAMDHDPDGSYGWYNRYASDAVGASTPLERSRLLRAYGTRWVLSAEWEEFPIFQPTLGVVIAGRRLILRTLDDPVPEIRWVGREYRRASPTAVIHLLRSEAFDPQTDIALPGRVDSDPPTGRVPTGTSLAVSRLTPESVSAVVSSGEPGYAVFARTYFPTWNATLDGRPARTLVANARDVAVAVPAGRHEIAIDWNRGPFHRGVAWQAAGLLAALVVGAFTCRAAAPVPA